MSFLAAAILGVIEGLTEFLPVSSTGHLILAAKALRLPDSEFLKSFQIAIQLGAILAVLAVSWRRLLLDRRILARVAVAFLPTAVIGFALYRIAKTYLLGNAAVTVWALIIGGIVLIAFEKLHKPLGRFEARDLGDMTYKEAAAIGLAQSVAIIPGVSRSAATILGGLALGWKRSAIVEFSFLLAVPTMAAATGLDLLKSGFAFTGREFGLLAVGFLAAFATALAAARWFLRYVRAHDFAPFGIYRILAAGAFWWFILR